MNPSKLGRGQRAFTLVELLVVIAIIGVLVGLLLPAVQAARETARRMQCSNNLKQVGLALHNYHDSRNAFPPGYISDVDSTGSEIGPGWGWASMVLPQLEQAPLFERINFAFPIENPINSSVRVQSIPTLLCPSDPAPSLWMTTRRSLSTGVALGEICEVASANYVGVFGTSEPGVGGDGIFFRNVATKFRDILDGTSTTLMVGERSFRLGEATWTGAVTDAVTIPDGSDGVGTGPPEASSGLVLGHTGDGNGPGDNRSHVNQFYSLHSGGGSQFLFCDGHVVFLNRSIDYQVYQALTTRAGGEPTDSDF
jgi:prepilin-type N-terminal cleavage/methylation domain-containing protein/prepilin-type processing-associated H-X9-DG protein